MVMMGKGYCRMLCMNHGLGSFTRARWWGIISPEVNLQKKKALGGSLAGCSCMSFRGISDASQPYFIHLGLGTEQRIVY